MVINTDPCYAYLQTGNEIVDQKLVMAHVYGHCDFFKNNMWFSKTNRKMLDEMANHASRIRDYQDRGILILCDPRLVNKPYGAAFLKSLPPIPRCRDLTRLSEFWTIPDMPVVEPAALLQPALLQEETITDENSGD